MAAPKQDAAQKITDYINGLPGWSQALCNRLRRIILAADPSIVEDWKWGPHYASN